MAAPAYVKASTGSTDATGAWTHTISAAGAAGNLIFLVVVQDGNTNAQIGVTSVTNMEDLAGTDNVLTKLDGPNADDSWPIGAGPSARLHIWVGRALNTTAPVVTGTNAGSEDVYVRAYEFSGVNAGTTVASILENGSAGTITAGNGSSTSGQVGTVTSLGADRRYVCFVGMDDDASMGNVSGDSPAVIGNAIESYTDASGTDGGQHFWHVTLATAQTQTGGSATVTPSAGWGYVAFALIPAGAAANFITPSGSITPEGALVKAVSKPLGGGITPSGALVALLVKVVTLAGSITPTGTLTKLTGKRLGGGFTPTGTLVRAVGKLLSGGVTPTGTLGAFLVKMIALAGGITPNAAWPPQLLDDFTGSDGSIDGRTAAPHTWESPLFQGNNVAQIASNQFAGHLTQDRDAGITTRLGPNCWVAVTITAGTWVPDAAGDQSVRLFARITNAPPAAGGSTAWYDLFTNAAAGINDEVRVRRVVNGSGTTVLDADIGVAAWSAGDSFGASFIEEPTGTRIRVYFKTAAGAWSEIGNTLDTDSARPTGPGYIGLACYSPSNGFLLDDFSGGTLPGLTLAVGKVLGGSVTPTGALRRDVSRFLAGSITPVGLLTAVTQKFLLLAGAIVPSGALTRASSKVLSGAITPQGTAVKAVSKPLSGSVTPSGVLTKGSSRTFSGSVTPSGTLVRAVQKFLAGTIGPSGALSTLFTPGGGGGTPFTINLAGAITPVGTLTKAAARSLAGAITPTGTLAVIRQYLRSFAGSITPTGTLRRGVTKNFTGGIIPSGTLNVFVGAVIFLAGAITPTGTLVKAVTKRLSGSITPSGAIRRDVAKFFAGAIVPQGILNLFTQGVTIIGSVWGGDRGDSSASGGTRGDAAAGGTRSGRYASGGDRRSDP